MRASSFLPRLSVLTLCLGLVAAARAQPAAPHIGYVYPAGGQQGKTFQVAVGGQFLDGVTNVFLSGPGVRAVVKRFQKPLTPMQLNNLREQLRQLQQKRLGANPPLAEEPARRGPGVSPGSGTGPVSAGPATLGQDAQARPRWTAEDAKVLAEIRQKLATYQRRPASPAIAETATLEVTVAEDAEPGHRELRLGAALGLSNPMLFCVGQLPEFLKQTPEPANEPLNRKGPRNSSEPTYARPSDMPITVPAVVNGQLLPSQVDHYRFQARQGQQLVISVSARELIPYLADAVPGWFQATLAVFDDQRKELAYDDDYRFHPDPVLFFKVPKDGEYMLEIKDAIYRGREDFVYRLTLGELPFITSVFPLGGPVGTATPIQLTGWNLPTDKLTPSFREPGLHSLSVRKGQWLSNLLPFSVDTLPECLEQEPNDSPATAQPVTLPIIINGRIDKPGDWDVFRFDGHAGDQLVAEVFARRLDSPLDSVLKLTDETGRQLAFNDDYEDKGYGLNTHHADSYLTATLPANGPYYVHIGDAQHQGGPEYAYRLRISQPLPDFALRLVPSSITVRAGMSVPITAYALRKDGLTNGIALALKGAPTGFALSGAWVPPGQDQVRLTLTAPPQPLEQPVKLFVEGRATIADRTLVRPAVPAEDMMQAFAFRHLVPARELEVAVIGRARPRGGPRVLTDTPIQLPAGGTAKVRVGLPSATQMGQTELELSDPPAGISLRNVAPAGQGSELLLACDAAKAKPGLRGNLIVNIYFTNAPDAKQKAQPNRRRNSPGALPAIPFEVVAP